MDKIRLTEMEQKMRDTLLRLATGIDGIRIDYHDDYPNLLYDYEEFKDYHGVSSSDFPQMLQRISLYDFQHGQPLLECLLTDLGGRMLGIDSPLSGLPRLLDDLYGPSKLTTAERIDRERCKVEWYWHTNKNVPERLTRSLNGEHIIVQQQDLARWTQEDLPAIAMQKARHQINIRIRYIVFDKGKPRFGYADYGEFYFLGERLFIITGNKDIVHLSDPDAADILSHAALECPNAAYYDFEEDFIDEDIADIVTVHLDAATYTRNLLRDKKLQIIPALFAGMRTNLYDSKTGNVLYTGDAVSVRFEGQSSAMTAGLGVVTGTDHYGLILDNHALPIPDYSGRKMKLYRAGSMFYHLTPYQQSLYINSVCSGYAQSRASRDITRLQIKASPCLAKTDLEWIKASTLGII